MNIFDLLHSGRLYDPNDSALAALQRQCLEKLYDYNATRPREQARRAARSYSSRSPTGAHVRKADSA